MSVSVEVSLFWLSNRLERFRQYGSGGSKVTGK